MRRLTLIALLPLVACSQPSQGSGGGDATGHAARMYDLAGFTAVALRGPDDVDVRVGSGFSVRAEGPAAQLDRLRITREGDTLRIDRKSDSGLNWGSIGHVKVFVTMPRITAADLVGSGDLAIDRIDGERFQVGAQGSGDVAIGSLAVERADLSMSGTGTLTARGTARTLALQSTGTGDVDAAGLTAANATISASGTGDVHVTVDGPARVSASGTGDVDLGGRARCAIQKSGTGEVRCG